MCKFPGCELKFKGRQGYCRLHYDRLRRNGDPADERPETQEYKTYKKSKEEITLESVKELVEYDAENGKLFWKARGAKWFEQNGRNGPEASARIWNSQFAGKECFISLDSKGYHKGHILWKSVAKHRMIWFIETGKWPKDQIDHINGIITDNRFCNLREVDDAENKKNMPLRKDNKTGHVGLWWDEGRGKYQVRIKVDGKTKHLGRRESYDDAVALYRQAANEYGYHKNHGRNNEYQ
jgi:hypothetical protein